MSADLAALGIMERARRRGLYQPSVRQCMLYGRRRAAMQDWPGEARAAMASLPDVSTARHHLARCLLAYRSSRRSRAPRLQSSRGAA